MNKIERFGMECELSAVEQHAYMIKKELKKKNSNYIKISEYLIQIKNSVDFCQWKLS